MTTPSAYDRRYFGTRDDTASRSAEVIVPMLMELASPRSVVDVGCGLGAWLAAFEAAGVHDSMGVDGDYVDLSMLRVPRERFHAAKLPAGLDVGRTFDLALCLEVAEHLPGTDAGTLVERLTSLAPVVAFSAAVPLQGGTGHVNEQWPEYWARLFAGRGLVPADAIRPRVWSDERVAWWYRQNFLVFVREADLPRYPGLAGWRQRTSDSMLSLVHPVLLERRNRRPMGPIPLRTVTGLWFRSAKSKFTGS